MIYIQTIDRYWNPGIHLATKVDRTEFYEFQLWCSNLFVTFIKACIDRQRYIDKWKALTPGYLAYKKKHGLSPNIWEATGQLKNSLKVLNKYNKHNIVIGFDMRAKHKRAKNLKLHELAKMLEYGTTRIPPRPLFRLALNYFRHNTSYLYKRFQRERMGYK